MSLKFGKLKFKEGVAKPTYVPKKARKADNEDEQP
jgi:hypothetical protein